METVDKNPPSVLSDPQEGEHPAINFLWVILDGSKLTDGQKKKIGRRYKAFSLKPSHIFDSNGSRCVLLWSLKKTTPEDIPKPVIENLLKRLASHFYGDPGIPDLPQDLPQWEIAESHPERKYNIEDFDSCLPQIEGIKKEEKPYIETELRTSPQVEDASLDTSTGSEGWIKLFRKIERSEVFQNEGLLKVWIWCLIRANHQNHWIPMKRGKGTTQVFVRRGQFIFGRESASKALKMPESTVQDRIVKLQSNRYIDIKSDTYYSTITVCNYEKYQSNEGVQVTGKEGEKVTDKENPKATGKQQVSNTYKNYKNIKPFVEGSDELRLASLLLEEIQKSRQSLGVSPIKQPDLQSWARPIGLLIRVDSKTVGQIEEVIKYSQGSFLGKGGNILSTEKLRKHFPTLEQQMASEKKGKTPERPQKKMRELTFSGGEA